MAVRIGINGFGRIGRLVARVALARDDIELVAVNDLADAESLAMLFKYESTHGIYQGTVEARGENLVIDGREIRVLSERDPADLSWGGMEAKIVIESTGVFRTRKKKDDDGNVVKPGYDSHIEAGAERVILTVPAKDDVDATIVLGVNDDALSAEHVIVSNASCTTNCLAPMVKVLNDAFGIEHGLMTTIHAYTNDQRILDMIHTDLRRARTAAGNIIPTTTGAAKAVGKVIPALNGKLDGMAMRVPVSDGSVTDFVAVLSENTTVDEVKAAFKAAADGALKGILQYEVDPIVSSDIIGNDHSCIFDSPSTAVMQGNMVKVIGWYDNEWGYSNRVVDLIGRLAAL